MLREIRSRVKKVGQPPGSLVYTGVETVTKPVVRIVTYSEHACKEYNCTPAELVPEHLEEGTTWVHVEGLQDVTLIEKISTRFNIHPLTIEDILNVTQRPKVEAFEDYLFITFKMLTWNDAKHDFSVDQISIILGHQLLISLCEKPTPFFTIIREHLQGKATQRLRQQQGDYLFYRILDTIVDQYFIVLEKIGNEIEELEELIVHSPSQRNSQTLYHLKRQMLAIRKIIWPMREVVSHLLQVEEQFISHFTHIYLRDVYDHVVQAIDTIETFRDMLSGSLDRYLSSLTIHMNEIMKVLTIIATIFIPITFIASVYGMNFKYMPELNWYWGYPVALSIMFAISLFMLYLFRKYKWI